MKAEADRKKKEGIKKALLFQNFQEKISATGTNHTVTVYPYAAYHWSPMWSLIYI